MVWGWVKNYPVYYKQVTEKRMFLKKSLALDAGKSTVGCSVGSLRLVLQTKNFA